MTDLRAHSRPHHVFYLLENTWPTEKVQMRTYFRENIDITLTKKTTDGKREPEAIPERELTCVLPGFPDSRVPGQKH